MAVENNKRQKNLTDNNNFKHSQQEMDLEGIRLAIADRLTFNMSKDRFTATQLDWLDSVSYAVRDRLIERWMNTMNSYYQVDSKRVYYLSLEFLIGRTLTNAMLNLGIEQECRQVMHELGQDLGELSELEPDAALGNGGLGRLAACFLDSMATLQLPGYGYGIRYEYGMFRQRIEDGYQVEHPDNWLRYGNPWEIPRAEILFPIRFGGKVVRYRDEDGMTRYHWVDAEEVMAMAFDTPIPGYDVGTVNNMRLWSAKASRDFELQYFNEGNYIKAVEDKNRSENLSRVLYPDDTTAMGRLLRLKQEYFFVCASLQDILLRYEKHQDGFDNLPDKVAIQLNDTHPAIAVVELMRILMDIKHLDWNKAWSITTRVFSYTCHTLLPEALESWPLPLFESLLPRHISIIYDINYLFLKDVNHHFPGDSDLLKRVSLIDDEGEKHIRMAHLAIVGSHKVNGVAKIHSQLMQDTIFADFNRIFPGKFINLTNGVTPRLWLNQANPVLSGWISKLIGSQWLTDLKQLQKLESYACQTGYQNEFLKIKQENKVRLCKRIASELGIEVNPDALFDVQVKRIHEYKRQLLNILHIITLYNRIRHNPDLDIVPRMFLISGKAAPAYSMAKLIIKLTNDIAEIINNDHCIKDKLKVVFMPNYDVSHATIIIPAADLSEQISTAGTEASGTGNMKLALNGALTIGTLDGANVEIMEEVGAENIFIFGHTVEEIQELRQEGYSSYHYYENNDSLREVINLIDSDYFCPEEPERYKAIVDSLLNHDPYFVMADYQAYIDKQLEVDILFQDKQKWAEKALLNIARMGHFSSDRTILEYAEKVWDLKPVVPGKL
ncbi:MAG: glycogen/starch/alpha-glucan phosphorylase [Gammaproteobacteria bacterium]|nr:glycogen/starch/alpha-glucan phosphorylase [Gammaproteobacteria bacterium]